MNKPGYKHTPLGWIPEDWEVKNINETTTIYVGRDLQEENYAEEKNNEFQYPVYSNTVDQEGLYGYYNFEEYSGECLTIIGRGAGLGTAFYRNGSFGAIGRLLVLFPNNKMNAKFITEYFNGHIKLFKEDGGIPQLTGEQVGKYLIPLPPLPEQHRIATILSTWDAAIAKEQQLIDTLQTRHRALMQQLLSGKKRLKGFKGEWKKVSYGSLLKEIKRPVIWSDDELYELISVRRRSGGIFSREALFGYQIKVKDLRTANVGDFLFSKMQIVHGASALVTQDFHGAKISGSYIAVIARDSQKLNMQFFNWYSQQPYFYHQTYVSSFGVHIEKMTFDFEAFLSLEMTLPPLAEQTAIANILRTSEKEIQTHRRRLATLQQQKKGLMQVLLTGKVRVKINVKESHK